MESIAQHEKQQKAQQLAEEKYKKFLTLTDTNMSMVSETLKWTEKKLKEELKDQWSETRFEEIKKILKTVKATAKTSSSKHDGSHDSPYCTHILPPSPLLPPPPPPKLSGVGTDDEGLKRS